MNHSGALMGKVAVITGGASGIGRATALRFLSEGAEVVVGDLNASSGASFLEAASAVAGTDVVRFVHTDVGDETQIERLILTAMDEFGGLDVVFNNAGVGGAFGPVSEIEAEDWDYTFAILTRAVFLGVKHAARIMQRHGRGGSIINTASVAAFSGGASPLAYSAAKAAVVNLTQGAAVELARHRIRVNAICPGLILTPLAAGRAPIDVAAPQFDTMQPWPDHGVGDDIAKAALFLASDESRFMTGSAMVVDGGMHAAGPGLLTRVETTSPTGAVGVNRGTTGQATTIRSRGSVIPTS
ncbi:MAG: short-chain dehydrogenase [Acidimicrobiales bacterium]|nr:short-chain dehydrogenase [Acidimicrobiales bacterium]